MVRRPGRGGMVAASASERAHVNNVFDDNGVFDKLFAVLCLALTLLLLDLGVSQYRHGGSAAWVLLAAVLLPAAGWETVRRFRPRR